MKAIFLSEFLTELCVSVLEDKGMVGVQCGQQQIANVEAIVFDKDGTLANSHHLLQRTALARAEACAAAAGAGDELIQDLLTCFGVSAHGIDPDGLMAAGTREANKQAAVMVLVKMGHPPGQAKVLVADCFAAVNAARNGKAAHTPPFEGTAAMLKRLNQSPLKIAVLSSDSPAYVEEFLSYYDLLPWVHEWQGTGPEDPPKPDPTLLRVLCDRLQVSVAHTLVVGDSWADLALAEQAKAAGFVSVSEPWGRSPVAGATLVLGQWDDLTVETEFG
ncbi:MULTISPECIES: HAD family hydrolase [Cyanophyceae]|uniref:HAD family hydrolase n=2 Tax=Cyanobacteriota TaxID=1117 RepID=UPI0016836DE3|nr:MULTISPECIES: HAD family hydrolase [Cyanophyceae]MBD1918986.1 HAD family hydrolase [Phormidium sp. FACHB-77]MBD2033149.1 HAD family hydrolase [Phormidium sp. FACHB-322]MBD2054075.1 HAD family hydrolase [Leptolyngbya sp. FACHB-60]